jgi:hypothetical protein
MQIESNEEKEEFFNAVDLGVELIYLLPFLMRN